MTVSLKETQEKHPDSFVVGEADRDVYELTEKNNLSYSFPPVRVFPLMRLHLGVFFWT